MLFVSCQVVFSLVEKIFTFHYISRDPIAIFVFPGIFLLIPGRLGN